MSQPPNDDDQPVRNGLLALVGVSVAVGLVLALVALAGTHILGIAGGGGSDDAGPGAGESMYIPAPEKTTEAGGPLITLNTQDTGAPDASAGAAAPSEATASSSAEQGRISLQALETTVPSFGKIDLSGTYPGGEGQVLQVQRKQVGGPWTDFPATVPVSDATFATYVQTGQTGRTAFRVLDKARHVMSNPVRVVIQ